MTLAAGAATAGSRDVQYGPPPTWVIPAPAPTTLAPPEGAAGRVIYSDLQTRLGAAGDETYTAYRLKILTPQALAAGNIAANWNPSTDDIIVHRLHVIRGGQVIDVLAANKFAVIQRENNLDYGMLDGELTANLQIPGLEVGDELEFAATIRRRETIFGGRSHGFEQLPMVGTPGAYRMRLVWPTDRKVRLNGTPDLGRLAAEDHNNEHELRYELRDPQSPIVADEAPPRANLRRLLEYSEFSGWAEISALMAPVFDKAAQLGANSPIRAEAASIAKASDDPAVRALAALQLVEDRIRYVYVGLDGGNYKPASADDTWTRRFGDCKAKTVLLMALLHELGIQGEAVLVNSKGVDGADQRLPTPQVFDHVVVRATIKGKAYWLDGTRLGDRRLSSTLLVPTRWALPIRISAGELEAVAPEAPLLPLTSVVVDIDVRAGISKPAKIYMEEIERGDQAPQMKAALAGLSRQDADRELKSYWRQTNPWLQPETVSWRYDDLQQALVLTVRGDGKMDWEGDDKQGHALDVMSGGFTPPNEMRRPAEQDQSAPWLVEFPKYKRWTTVIRLPPPGPSRRWYLYEDPVDLKLGGWSYHREAELDGGVVRSTMSTRSYQTEITAAQAAEVNEKLASFNNKISRVYEANPGAVELSPADQEKAAGKDWRRLGALAATDMQKGQWADADRLFAKVLVIQPDNAAARQARAASLAQLGRFDEALKLLDGVKASDAATGLSVQYSRAQILIQAKRKDEGLALLDSVARTNASKKEVVLAVSQMLLSNGESERALPLLTDGLKLQPDDAQALQLRGVALARLGRGEEALSDLQAVIRLKPEDAFALKNRGAVLAQLGRREEALGDMDEAWRANPLNADFIVSRTELLRKVGRAAEAPAVFDAWVARDHSGTALNDRCWARALGNVELAAAETDCAQAVALAPKAGAFWDSYGLIALRQGRLDEAIKRYDKALELAPKLAGSLYGRGLAKIKAGDKAGGDADIAAAKAIAPNAGTELTEAGL